MKSETKLEYEQTVIRTKRLRIILITELAIIYLPCNLLIFIFKEDLKNENYDLLTLIVIIRAISMSIF